MSAIAETHAVVAPTVADMTEEVPCLFCGTREPQLLYPALDHQRELSPVFAAATGVRGLCRIVRCPDCRLAWVSPRLPSRVIAEAYRQSEDPLYVAQAEARRRSFRRNLALVNRYARGGRLLDVGCAAGYFLDVCRDAGWDAHGIEPNAGFVTMAQSRHGPAVTEGTLSSSSFEPQSFDVVTMWDVLEHSTDPRLELEIGARLLRPGGLLFVNFPNIESLSARLTGPRWWFLLSHHLYYFTPSTLRRLLEQVGFGVLSRHLNLQTLELGYLAGMMRLYSDRLAEATGTVLSATRLDRLRFSYYAGQLTLVAAK